MAVVVLPSGDVGVTGGDVATEFCPGECCGEPPPPVGCPMPTRGCYAMAGILECEAGQRLRQQVLLQVTSVWSNSQNNPGLDDRRQELQAILSWTQDWTRDVGPIYRPVLPPSQDVLFFRWRILLNGAVTDDVIVNEPLGGLNQTWIEFPPTQPHDIVAFFQNSVLLRKPIGGRTEMYQIVSGSQPIFSPIIGCSGEQGVDANGDTHKAWGLGPLACGGYSGVASGDRHYSEPGSFGFQESYDCDLTMMTTYTVVQGC